MLDALKFIIPLLNKHQFKWVITGGFACIVYGVDRALTDIDIDIDTSKDSIEFKSFLKDIEPYISSPLEHFVDQNYDNYNVELTILGQTIDICPMAEMNIFDKSLNKYINFYQDGFPDFETVNYLDIKLPLLSKDLIIKNKQMLVWQRDSDLRDINELSRLNSLNGV